MPDTLPFPADLASGALSLRKAEGPPAAARDDDDGGEFPDVSNGAMRLADDDRMCLRGGLMEAASLLDLDPLEPNPIMPRPADALLAVKLWGRGLG